MKLKYLLALPACALFLMGADGGCERRNTADEVDQRQQEQMMAQARAQAGLPSIVNFQEKKNLKMILELRDQEKLNTYTYLFAENSGQLVFLGRSIGYGIPAATQYTNPQKAEYVANHGYMVMPQADPNGLFSPASAEGTWVMLVDDKGEPHPIYVEPRIIVSPFPLK
jgi:hypothetical protein